MGQTEACASMLVRLGRLDEAVEYGREHLRTADGALRLAQRLRDRGALKEALEVAECGTRLSGPKAELATWLCDLARGIGQPELALRAAVLAFREGPDLSVYLSARELAGPGWDSLRDELLTGLRGTKPPFPAGPVEVFLHEGLIEDAMVAVKGSWDYRLIEHVAEAAIETHPDWVIETCRNQAEAIMHPGRADLYGTAVRWLGYAREAYRVAGCEHEWQAYLQELIVRHARKYKLRPMLEALRR